MQLLKAGQLKVKFQLSDEAFYEYLTEGIPHYKVDGKARFLEPEVKNWIEQYEDRQKRLEEEFVDEKGRKLDAYSSDEDIAKMLNIDKKEITNLALKGMPYLMLGNKVFFQPEDILEYFRVEAGQRKETGNFLIRQKPSTKETIKYKENTLVVDGSYIPGQKKCSSGLVWKNEENTVGYAFTYQYETKYSVLSEWLGILEALRLVDREGLENVIIATDQKQHINQLNIGEMVATKIIKKDSNIAKTIREINLLLVRVRDRVVFRYAKEQMFIRLYKEAHNLSTMHKNKFLPIVKIPGQSGTVGKNETESNVSLYINGVAAKETVEPVFEKVAQVEVAASLEDDGIAESLNTVQDDVEVNTPNKDAVVIKCGRKTTKSQYFEVHCGGDVHEYRRDKLKSPIKSVMEVAGSFTSNKKGHPLKIEAIPNFESYINSDKDIEWFCKMYEKIKDNCTIVETADDFEKHLYKDGNSFQG